jgi:hypothetical protein
VRKDLLQYAEGRKKFLCIVSGIIPAGLQISAVFRSLLSVAGHFPGFIIESPWMDSLIPDY